jgi:nascent polypeptide-associated complex subunit beta
MITLSFTSRDPSVRLKMSIRLVVQVSVRENLLVVTGNPETKELKDMMPDILKQVGPQQFSFLKDMVKNIIPESKAEEDEDDVPELVGNFEDASKK